MAAITRWAAHGRQRPPARADLLAPLLPKPRQPRHGYCRPRAALTGRASVARGRNRGSGLAGNQPKRTSPDDDEPTPGPTTTWPTQKINKGWGMTLNGPDWKTQATAYYAAMTNPDEWEWARIEVRWDSAEPSAGSYNFNAASVAAKIAWCQTRGIRPILDITYCPWFYTIQPQYSGCSITNAAAGGKARISCPNDDTGGLVGGLDGGNWVGVHCRGTGIPDGALVTARGSSGGVPYVDLDKVATATGIGIGKTVTFGGYKVGSTVYAAEQDKHMPPADSAFMALATFGAALVRQFATQDDDTDEIVVEFWNEANGGFWRPRQIYVRYATALRYLYRGIKEAEPTVAVATTGVQDNGGHGLNGWLLDGPDFLNAVWGAMAADTTWTTWLADTTGAFTTYSRSVNNLHALRAAGLISSRFYVDLAGYHMYAFGRTGSLLNADNATYITELGASSTAAKFVKMLNDIYTRAHASGSDVNFDKIKFLSTETGCPWHPLAKTGVGARVAEVGIAQPRTASSEESYVNFTLLKKLVKRVLPWPTGTGIPAKLGTWEPNTRLAVIVIQRLAEVAEGYSGADSFANTGMFTNVASPGPPAISAGTLKRAVGADATSRQHLTTGAYSNANIGSGVDAFDAFDHVWT